VSRTFTSAGLKEEDVLKYVDVLAKSRFAMSKETMGFMKVTDLVAIGVPEKYAKLICTAVSGRVRCGRCGKALHGNGDVENPPVGLCSNCWRHLSEVEVCFV